MNVTRYDWISNVSKALQKPDVFILRNEAIKSLCKRLIYYFIAVGWFSIAASLDYLKILP